MDEDWLIIRDEPFLKDWGNLIAAFNDSVQGLYYRPLLIITFILDYHIGHLNPLIYHFTNVLIHALCVVTLYKLLLELKSEKVTAFFLAAIFSVHPIALHAVAWIPGRNDLLLCLFSLLSIYYLVQYVNKHKISHAILHVLFFMMALFSKENSVFLVPVFIFIWFISKSPDRKKLMFISFVWLLQILLWYVLMSGVIKTTLSSGSDIGNSLKGFFAGFLSFIGKAFIPIQQSVSPNIDNSRIEMVIGVMAMALFGVMVYKFGFHNKKTALLGLLIYFGLLLVPVWFGATSPLGEHLEHRSYTSMIGYFIFISQIKINVNSGMIRNVLAIIVFVFALKTFIRMNIYKDGFSYISEAAADCPKNYFFHARKGNFLFDAGRIPESIECYNTAISLYQKKPQVYNDRANSYLKLGKKEEAIADYTKAFELGKNPQVLVFRCVTYQKFGDYENAFKDLSTLTQCCNDLIPKGLEQEIVTGLMSGRLNELNKLIAAEPNNALLYVNRAKFYIDRRMGVEALADLKKACDLEPKNEEFRGYFNELNSSFPH